MREDLREDISPARFAWATGQESMLKTVNCKDLSNVTRLVT
jgi:hypothetical protein